MEANRRRRNQIKRTYEKQGGTLMGESALAAQRRFRKTLGRF
jgi:hypothetical protein